jgi:adenylate cyclase class IV
MQMVDFKAELRDPSLAEDALRLAGAERVACVRHTDTHFRVPDAHLLRRILTAEGSATATGSEWLFYTRPNRVTPRISMVCVYTEPAAADRFGAARPPVWLILEKERTTWVAGDVRVHLDDVTGLGRFVEFEMRVSPRRNVARCHRDIGQLRKLLRPAMGEAIGCGYRDLMALEQEIGPTEAMLPAGPA